MPETGYISECSGPLLGERVDRDGAFTSRRGPSEGSVARPADRPMLKRNALQTARPRSPSFPRPSFVFIDIPGLFLHFWGLPARHSREGGNPLRKPSELGTLRTGFPPSQELPWS